jgi:hypothetical protein
MLKRNMRRDEITEMKYEYEKYIYKAEMETRRYETKIETFR